MFASRTLFGRFGAFNYVAAVDAMPLHGSLLFENLSPVKVAQEFKVTGLMEIFNLAYLLK